MLGLPGSAAVVAFAARCDTMKNVPLFLASAREFLNRHRTGHVVMCGPGMSRTNPLLRAQIREVFGSDRGSLARLHQLGVRHDMENIYRAADVVALTSSVGEAAPLCLIEGLLCGAVPVATDVGDCAEIVDGRGLVVAPDPVAISAAWTEAVIRRDEFAATLAASAERFSHRRMVMSYSEIIDRVARSRPVTQRSLLPM